MSIDKPENLHVERVKDDPVRCVTTFSLTIGNADLIALIDQAARRRARAKRAGETLLLIDLLGILVAGSAMTYSPHLGKLDDTCTFCGGPLKWLRMGALTIKQEDREFCDQICLESWQDEVDAQRGEADET